VHCNDWQTGIVPALLSLERDPPSTVFTIHNMAYQGYSLVGQPAALNLPSQLWHPAGLEFHEMLSLLKAAWFMRITLPPLVRPMPWNSNAGIWLWP